MGNNGRSFLSVMAVIIMTISLLSLFTVGDGKISPPSRDIQEDFGGGVSEGLPTTGDYNCVGVGDINNDGYQDMVIGAEENYGTLGTTGLYAFFGDGAGNWTQHTITTTGSYAAIEIRDVDEDGNKEVFAGYQEYTNGIGVWEWNGTQFLTSGISSPVTRGNVNYLRIENISGSSGMDLVSAANGGVKYFQGNGNSPVSWTEYSTGLRSSGLSTCTDVNDFNNDGILDILLGQYGDGLYLYTQNSGSTSWTDETDTLPSVEHSGRILGLVSGDVNNDGNVDIIFGRYTSPFGLFLLLGNGGGTSGNDLQWTYANSSWTNRPTTGFYQMQLDDIDKDGDLDLLAATENTGLHLYLGNGSDQPGSAFGWNEVTDKDLPSDMKFYGSNFIDFDNDGDLDIAGCTWGNGARVYQNNDTQPAEPVARAGMDITVFLGDPVMMDGTNSSDAQDCTDGDEEGTILTYSWNLTDQPSSSSMTDLDLSPSDSSSKPTFTPTHPGNYTFTLSVQDTEGYHARSEDEIRISVILINTDPIANAGEDQTVFTGDQVTLNGSQSHDDEDTLEQLSFLWEVNSSNPVTVDLDDASSMEPVFTAPDTIGTYRFSLVVSDSFNFSSSLDEVNITVQLRPNIDPTADAGDDIQGIANSTIQLDGTGSSDTDGEIITWTWNCTSHENINLMNSNSSTPSFVPNRTGDYVFTLDVMDDRGGISDMDSVMVSISPDNYPPAANAGKNQTVNVNTTVILNGTLSSDPEGSIVTWEWISITDPGLVLNNTNSTSPEIFMPEVGEFIFSLRVLDDREMWSNTDHVKVTVLEEDINITDPIENTPPSVRIIYPSEDSILNGTVEIEWAASDEDGDTLSIRIDLISLPGATRFTLYDGPMQAAHILELNTSNYDNGTYEMRFIVTDGFDEVIITISPLEIKNEEIVVITDDDDDDDDTTPVDDDDDDDEEPPIQEDNNDNKFSMQMIIGIIVVLVIAGIIIFAIVRKVHESMDGRNEAIYDEE